MRKQVETLQDHIDYNPAQHAADESTSHLDSGLLASGSNLAYDDASSPIEDAEQRERPNTDWLRVLAAQPEYPETFDDPLPEPPPEPSGMAFHSVPARIGLTFGARLALGLRRGTLLLLASALAVGVLAGGFYALSSTSWFSPALTLTSPPTGKQPPPADSVSPGRLGASQAADPDPQQAQPGSAPRQAPGAANAPAGAQDSVSAGGGAGSARAQVESGIAQYKLGNYDRAIDLLQSAVDANGGDAVTYYQLGLAYIAASGREHALDDAEMAFRTAISLQPGWAAPHQLLAEALIRRGYFSGAIDPAKQAVQLDPNQAESWLTLGRAYRGAGQEAEARKAEAEAAQRSHP